MRLILACIIERSIITAYNSIPVIKEGSLVASYSAKYEHFVNKSIGYVFICI